MGGCTNKSKSDSKPVEKHNPPTPNKLITPEHLPPVPPITETIPDAELRQGKWYYKNGDVYEGEVKNNKPNGKGIYIDKSAGERYEGEIENGSRHGCGVIVYNNGARAEGSFNRGFLHGPIKLKHQNYLLCELTYNNGRSHGTLIGINGDKYEGDLFESNFDGKGIYTWKDNDKYEGDFKNSKFNGKGKITFVNGGSFIGSFSNDKRYGRGIETAIITDANDKKLTTVYDGNWKDSIKDGEGVMTRERVDGSIEVIRGTWKNSGLHGYCEIRVDGILFYKGFYQDGYAVNESLASKCNDDSKKNI